MAKSRLSPYQGNLDPLLLLEDFSVIAKQVDRILSESVNNRPGYIFNLGHGIVPQTPMKMSSDSLSTYAEKTTR
ncbi:MAG: uroporphyrinogen decarboxylase family protein [Bdellovibrionota bacterium]